MSFYCPPQRVGGQHVARFKELVGNTLPASKSWWATRCPPYIYWTNTMEIFHLDHLVLTVKDVKSSCEFYTNILGMQEVTFKGHRKALIFGNQKINLHEWGNEFEPKAKHPIPGSADLCFIVNESLDKVVNHLEMNQVEIIEGPVERTGAVGKMMSVYIRDPDSNLIEISTY